MADLTTLYEGFRDPAPAARPMMRWWWFGPDVTHEDLDRDLDDIAAAGLGGVECAFVYPMGARSDRFLSRTFLADLRYAAEGAERRGLRFDITLGSGWPYGGPHIDETTASRRIHWEREEVPLQAQTLIFRTSWPGDGFIAAYLGEGTRGEEPQDFVPVEAESAEDGTVKLHLPLGRGPRVMLVAVSRLAGQTLKRASAGAEGLALDHLNPRAAEAHIAAVAEPLVEAAGAHRLGSVFCDSLEVYDSGWTAALPDEFAARRGYDLLPKLWMMTRTDDVGAGLRADVHRTQTELVEENFIAVFGQWASERGLDFRLQCYGQPPVTVSSYRHAGAFEGEGWGWDAVTACRWASSAAQIWGRQVVSSETWTWNHSPSFRSTPLDLLGEAHDHLLMGINHFIGHGWPTSPRPEGELGRVFYASGALDSRNAWWEASPALWRTLHRLAWLMRQGRRLSDVAVYVPARDIYAGFAAAGRIDLYKEARLHIGDALPHALRTAGLDYDLIDDDAVSGPRPAVDAARFPVVVLPFARDIPEATRRWLQDVEQAGGTVLSLDDEDQAELVAQRAAESALHRVGISVESSSNTASLNTGSSNTAVAVTSRVVGEGDGQVCIHFVANTGPHVLETRLELPESLGGGDSHASQSVIERWDQELGRRVQTWHGVEAGLTLHPHEAAVLIQHTGPPVQQRTEELTRAAALTCAAELPAGQELPLLDWTVQFPGEEPAVVELPHQWELHPGRELYSGTAVYTAQVVLPAGSGPVILDLGEAVLHQLSDPEGSGLVEASFSAEVRPPVGAVAIVRVDGAEAGVLWKTPYRLDLSDYVTDGGAHQLELEVANVTSHRLAVDPGIPRRVQEAHENYGKRFGIQTLDLALADVASGLLGRPVLKIGAGRA